MLKLKQQKALTFSNIADNGFMETAKIASVTSFSKREAARKMLAYINSDDFRNSRPREISNPSQQLKELKDLEGYRKSANQVLIEKV